MSSQVTLRIEQLTYGGDGLARDEGLVWFVPYTVPGDRALVEETSAKPSYRRGRVIRLKETSPDRTAPLCPWFGRCGGCQWQHITYDAQAAVKQSILDEMVRKSLKRDVPQAPLIPSPVPYGYRRRITLHHDRNSGRIGYYRAGSNEIIQIDDCPIAVQPIRSWLSHPPLEGSKRESLPERFELRCDGGEPGTVELIRNPADGPFLQANTEGNMLLTERVRELILNVHPRPRVFDLFCGDGNLSLPLAEAAVSIRGWDSSARAIEKAQQASAENTAVDYRVGNLNRITRELTAHAGDTDVLILDPPRQGIKTQARALAKLRIPTVVYVSCNPASLVRDLRIFEKEGYRTELIQGFDMFPQTYHLESIALLRVL